MNNKKFLLTPEGLESLKSELNKLQEEERPKLVERVTEAREKGDLSENTEYSQAREELSMMDGRIEELELILSRAEVVKKGGSCEAVAFGCQVTVAVNKSTKVFHLVGEWEADPLEQKISHSSPLGQALIGKKVGDKVEIEAPAGKIVYTVKKIH
jgi:transcription elongation factor GreA